MFFKMLYTGNFSRTEELSSKKSWLAYFGAADAVFYCSAGKLIPRKKLSLVFTLKSMISSKKVLILINNHGHCAGGETVQRIDICHDSTLNNDSFIPDSIETKPNL